MEVEKRYQGRRDRHILTDYCRCNFPASDFCCDFMLNILPHIVIFGVFVLHASQLLCQNFAMRKKLNFD